MLLSKITKKLVRKHTMTFAEKVITFNKHLKFPKEVTLPKNISVMNPFDTTDESSPETLRISTEFYKKFYSDNNKRHLILGINLGKSGAGITGIPFTSPESLKQDCGITSSENNIEISGRFLYEVIKKYGGVTSFYSDYLISNVCPLGFIKTTDTNRKVNRNYYDYTDLMVSTTPFIVKTLRQQIEFGVHTDKVFCLGNRDNFKYLNNLCKEHGLFDKVIPLPHPRYIAQYKQKEKGKYISIYLEKLNA